MKYLFTLMFLFLTFTGLKAQQIFDYYIPASPFIVRTFCKDIFYQNAFNLKRKIVYKKVEDGYDLIDTKFENGDIRYVETRSIVFINNEVRLKKYYKKDNSGVITEKKYDTLSVTLLKMPPLGKTISWIYIDEMGNEINCTASWTTVNEGYSKVALRPIPIIQVTKTNTKQPEQILFEYYKKGWGYSGTTKMTNDGLLEIIDNPFGGSSKDE